MRGRRSGPISTICRRRWQHDNATGPVAPLRSGYALSARGHGLSRTCLSTGRDATYRDRNAVARSRATSGHPRPHLPDHRRSRALPSTATPSAPSPPATMPSGWSRRTATAARSTHVPHGSTRTSGAPHSPIKCPENRVRYSRSCSRTGCDHHRRAIRKAPLGKRPDTFTVTLQRAGCTACDGHMPAGLIRRGSRQAGRLPRGSGLGGSSASTKPVPGGPSAWARCSAASASPSAARPAHGSRGVWPCRPVATRCCEWRAHPTNPRCRGRRLAYLLQIVMLGGYLARNNDPPPGSMVVWRDMKRLQDIAFSIPIGSRRRHE